MRKDKAMDINVMQIDSLEEIIGHKFNTPALLEAALTHSSYANEMKNKNVGIVYNERLEFLGDSVLSIIVSEHIFEDYKKLPEGELTKIRANVVCEKTLAKLARSIELGKYLRLGHGESNGGGRERASILADAFEAVLAAIYLDSGNDKEEVSKFLMPLIGPEIKNYVSAGLMTDYKTELQQIIQQAEGERLEYVLIGESGPDHEKVFEIEARLNSNIIGRGSGRSKRAAEQNAAKMALGYFKK